MIAWPLIDIDGAKRGQPLSIIGFDEINGIGTIAILQDIHGDVYECHTSAIAFADTPIMPAKPFVSIVKEVSKTSDIWVAIRQSLPDQFRISEDMSYAIDTYSDKVVLITIKDMGYNWELTCK